MRKNRKFSREIKVKFITNINNEAAKIISNSANNLHCCNKLNLEENNNSDFNKNTSCNKICESSKLPCKNTNNIIFENSDLDKTKINSEIENNINHKISNLVENSNTHSKIKNLEINFCEKRIINSPPFSPINSDYCHKFDKLNLDLNSLNDNIHKSEKFKIKSSDKLIFLEDYFKEENKNSKKRQKRIYSEFKPNKKFENFYFSNLKISNVNNFSFIQENKKIVNNLNIRKLKSSKTKKNLNLQISQNLAIEITAGGNIEENTNDEKEEWLFKENLNEKHNKLFHDNYINNKNKEYICCSCGNKNFIVD